MKKVILVLALTIGGCTSAVAGSCASSSCAASVDGTTFTVSLIGLTGASLTNVVNMDVTAYSASPGTDTFSVQLIGVQAITDQVGLNYGVAVSGNPGAAVTSVSTMFDGPIAGAMLSTEVTPAGGASLGEWDLASSMINAASSSHSTPSFVSAEVDTGINLPSGLTLAGFAETFTVIWGSDPPGDPVSSAPEPGSLGLIALAGFAGALFVRRCSLKK
jgi:hypothetical protein